KNYPNPFNPSTTISFSLPSDMACKLEIYNIRGQIVHTLLNENMMAGKHSIVWDAKDANGSSVSSGVYFYRLVTPNSSQTSKMLLMK
ncbi:MAG: T9SS type A sorting domain-containing protein, partial [Candidatus Cloacimonadaceae bacterium]